jgi:hypothetical protein
VFIDSDYGGVIDAAPSFIQSRFDSQEISAGGPTRRDELFRKSFRMFHDQVLAAQAYATTQSSTGGHGVGILLPDRDNGQGYSKRHKEMIQAEVEEKPGSRPTFSNGRRAWIWRSRPSSSSSTG